MAAGALAVAAAAAGLGTGTVTAPSAGAQTAVRSDVVSGNFTGDGRDEVFIYNSGPDADALIQFRRLGGIGGDIADDSFEIPVNGVYDPIAGDFDGDGYDEILWYAAGSAQDVMWNFTSPSTVQSRPYTVNGTYTPVVGDFTGDLADDILWYKPGTGQDVLWEYNRGGGYTSRARTINGTYTAVTGSFGRNNTDDILWYKPGTGQDVMWDYNSDGSYLSKAVTINGAYRPFVLDIWNDGWRGDDIFWYAPGPAGDSIWDYLDGVRVIASQPVDGSYTFTVPGDFLGGGNDDVLWLGETDTQLWDYTVDANGDLFRWDYIFTAPAAASAARSSSVAIPYAPTGTASATPGATLSR